MTYRTCHHAYDTGRTCASAAVTGQNYCAYHLHHRARLMRMAQYRARRQRLLLTLPPLENMYAVQSALNQLAEAAAAGMIDLKQARFLLSVVRAAGQFLLRADKWQATPYHSDQPGVEIDLVQHYGLLADLNLDLAPETVFPPDLSSRAEPAAAGGVEGPAFPDNRQPTTDNLPLMPFSGNYCGDHHTGECECCRIRPDYPVTPEMVEVVETSQAYGPDVAAARSRQLERNRQRRQLRIERKRYEAIALEHNMRRAADRMSDRKLADRAKQPELMNPKSEGGCRTPQGASPLRDSGNCGEAARKPVASADSSANLTAAEAKSSA